MTHALSAALWFCVVGLYFISPPMLPSEQPARRRAWALLGVAAVIAALAMLVEAIGG